MRIAVIGCGSIGTRHLQTLIALGQDVIPFDCAKPEMNSAAQWQHVINADAALICTPAASHAFDARTLLEEGWDKPLFVEKPLALKVEDCAVFAGWPHPTVQVGYQLRFHSDVWWLKDAVRAPTLAHVLVRWDARRYTHGLLESSHELDLLRFFMGDLRVREAYRQPDGELWVYFGNGIEARIHYGSATYYRSWHLQNGRRDAGVAFSTPEQLGAQMYRDELQHFLVCASQRLVPNCTVADGIAAIDLCDQVNELARQTA